jgi:hypothetical protein
LCPFLSNDVDKSQTVLLPVLLYTFTHKSVWHLRFASMIDTKIQEKYPAIIREEKASTPGLKYIHDHLSPV